MENLEQTADRKGSDAMGNVIVTGAFGTLGRAIVNELAHGDHRVVGIDIAAPPERFDGAHAVGGIDLEDEAAVAAAYRHVCDQVGSIDGLVNVAGGFLWETVAAGSLESWDRMLRINLRTALVSTRAALPHLIASGGSIVNVGAAAAAHPASGMGAYAASKSALHALTGSLAEEMRGRGVRVNAILPTIIDTPANRADLPDADASGWVKPEGAAKVVAFLLSPAAATITGVGIRLSLPG